MEVQRSGVSSTLLVGVVVVVLVIAAGIAYFDFYMPAAASASRTSMAQIKTVHVTILSGTASNSLNFDPAAIRVVVGVNNTIEWTNNDNTNHTVTSIGVLPAGAARFGSSNLGLGTGQTFTVTLTVPGTYKYQCNFHPSFMSGTIVVVQ